MSFKPNTNLLTVDEVTAELCYYMKYIPWAMDQGLLRKIVIMGKAYYKREQVQKLKEKFENDPSFEANPEGPNVVLYFQAKNKANNPGN